MFRWNTHEDRPHWSNIPTAVVFPPDQVLNFTVIESIHLKIKTKKNVEEEEEELLSESKY